MDRNTCNNNDYDGINLYACVQGQIEENICSGNANTVLVDNLTTRLQGDASTRGSLAWLQAQIDDATAKNRTQLATVLKNRLAVRTQTLVVLKQRHDKLAELADKCRAHGVDI